MRHRSPNSLLPFVLGLTLVAAGCGSNNQPGPTQAKVAAPVKKAPSPADSLSPYLVSAVTTGKTGATMLQVKYELSGRPDVGEPVDVDLVIIPQADNIDSISGTVQGDDGVEITSGETISPAEKPTFGNPIHRALKVRAMRDGIFSLSAALSIQTGGQTLAPVYSMPIIAGNGLGEAGAPSAPGQGVAKRAPAAAKPASTTATQ
jgi:hypothetical protein